MASLESKSLAFLSSVAGVGQRTLALLKKSVNHSIDLANADASKKAPEENWELFWALGSELWRQKGVSEKQICSIEKRCSEQTIADYFFSLENRQIRVLVEESVEYPPLLKLIDDPPTVLFAKGAALEWGGALSNGGSPEPLPVAVVGTRHITEYGRLVTEKITSELVINGCPIISGAMYGVDICAHQTALAWEGKTIGVLGYGFDFCYPKSYQAVFESFIEQGMTFISPFAPETTAIRGNFPARNAIVAGMSAGVVVTEAAAKSGTLITAGYAADFGRPVMAVPGSIFSPYSQGVTQLVNQGASLVTNGEEVLECLS
jgi:DNA processing protein